MQCADLAELISAYADGQISTAQAEFIEAHLTRCSWCRATLLQHRQTVELLRLADPIDEWPVPDLRLRITLATAHPAAQLHHRLARYGLVGGTVAALAISWVIAGPLASGPAPRVAQSSPPTAISTPACGHCIAPGSLTIQIMYRSSHAIGVAPPTTALPDQAGGMPGSGTASMSTAHPGGMRAIPT